MSGEWGHHLVNAKKEGTARANQIMEDWLGNWFEYGELDKGDLVVNELMLIDLTDRFARVCSVAALALYAADDADVKY